MNILPGKIEEIKTVGSLSIVKVKVKDISLKTIFLDQHSDSHLLEEGMPISIVFKETEVVIAKGDTSKISLQNKIKGKAKIIEIGDLLAKLTITTSVGDIISIITSAAVRQLQIKEGDEITAMIKTNETLLSQ